MKNNNSCSLVAATLLSASMSHGATVVYLDDISSSAYTAGLVNGQNGWSGLGPMSFETDNGGGIGIPLQFSASTSLRETRRSITVPAGSTSFVAEWTQVVWRNGGNFSSVYYGTTAVQNGVRNGFTTNSDMADGGFVSNYLELTPTQPENIVSTGTPRIFDFTLTLDTILGTGMLESFGPGAASKETVATFTLSGLNLADLNQMTLQAQGSAPQFLNFNVTAVPEPSSALLALLGIGCLLRRRRQT